MKVRRKMLKMVEMVEWFQITGGSLPVTYLH
jgi:hypothetical protein